MEPEGAGRRLAAIMFTDVVGYTALLAESEEQGHRVRERRGTRLAEPGGLAVLVSTARAAHACLRRPLYRTDRLG